MIKKSKIKHSWYSVSLLTAGHFFSDFYANFLPVLLPIVMPKLGLSLTMSGLLIMVLSFSSNVLQPYFGYLIDRKNFNWLLLITVPAGAIFICYTGMVNSQFLLFLTVALSGIAVSIFHPLGSSLVSKVASPAKLGISISIFVAGGNLGFALAPIIIVYFTEFYGLEALLLLAIPSLILSFCYYHSGLYRPNLKLATPNTTAKQLWQLCCQPALLKLNLAMGLRAWTHVAMTTFLPALLVANGYSTTFAGIMLTIFLIGAALGGLLGGYLSDHFGLKKIIFGSLSLGILPTYIFLANSEITWFTAVMLFLCGAGLQGSAPSSLVWAQRFLPHNAAMASGMMLGLSFGFGGIGAAITGALADTISLVVALRWTILALVLAAFISITIPEKSTKQESIS